MASSNACTSALCCSLLAAWAFFADAHAQSLPLGAAVQVEFVRPETFTDVRRGSHAGDEIQFADLEALGRHLVRNATRLLPAGQRLSVAITDVDMAGSFEPWRRHGMAHVRIVRNVYPARIALGFKLIGADGAVIKQGERRLSDPAFLMSTVSYRNDPLRHEKALLDDWLERELAGVRSRS